MISWIQRSFQNHFKVVFGLLLTVTIVSFIITIGATPGIGRADRSAQSRDFFGHNLASQGEINGITSDAELSIELQEGYNPFRDPEEVRNYALQRVAALHMADEWHLPGVALDSPELAEFIKGLHYFAGTNGQFDPQKYATFRSNLKGNEGSIARVLSDDLRIDKVQALLSGPGYVQPSDIKTELALEDTQWTIGTAEVDFASFHPTLTATDAEVAKYFSENVYKYQIPAQVSATYVNFPAKDYLAKVAVTDAEVRAYYDRDPSRFPKPAATQPKDAKKPAAAPKFDAAADYAAVKPAVEAALKLDRAKNLAAKDASDFAYSLYQKKVTMGPGLTSYLASQHLTDKPLAPFSEQAAPVELGGSPDIAQAAFQLSADRFYSEALTTPTGAVVLLWKANEPAHNPVLADVKDKVKTDYLESQKRKAFTDLGAKLKTQIGASIRQGLSFEKAAAAAAAADGVKVTAKMLPPFKLSDRPKDVTPTVFGALQHLQSGGISDLEMTGDQGTLVYAASKKLPDLTDSSPRYAAMRAQQAMYFSRLSAGEYLNQLVARELKRTGSEIQ